MGRLKHVTFTGINPCKKEDIETLLYLQNKYPFAEFGVLCSKNWEENGARFTSPENFKKLCGKNLNLSAHLCGSLAKEIAKGNWEEFKKYCNGYHLIFKRIQLNISQEKPSEENTKIKPQLEQEIIIQQKSLIEDGIYSKMFWNCGNIDNISMLIDASGGRGKKIDIEDLNSQIENTTIPINKLKIGYAGGLDENITPNLIYNLIQNKKIGDFWVDMESCLRVKENPKEFDYKKVDFICNEAKEVLRRV